MIYVKMSIKDMRLNPGQRRITATETECSDLKKTAK